MKRLRKRVGRDNFVTLVSLLMEVVAGRFGVVPRSGGTAERVIDDLILEKATGLYRARQRVPDGLVRLLVNPPMVRSAFADIAGIFRGPSFVQRVTEASAAGWVEVRDELRDLLLAITKLVRGLQHLFGRHSPFGLSVLADIGEDATTFDLAGMLILYRAMKDEVFRGQELPIITACRVFLATVAMSSGPQPIRSIPT